MVEAPPFFVLQINLCTWLLVLLWKYSVPVFYSRYTDSTETLWDLEIRFSPKPTPMSLRPSTTPVQKYWLHVGMWSVVETGSTTASIYSARLQTGLGWHSQIFLSLLRLWLFELTEGVLAYWHCPRIGHQFKFKILQYISELKRLRLFPDFEATTLVSLWSPILWFSVLRVATRTWARTPIIMEMPVNIKVERPTQANTAAVRALIGWGHWLCSSLCSSLVSDSQHCVAKEHSPIPHTPRNPFLSPLGCHFFPPPPPSLFPIHSSCLELGAKTQFYVPDGCSFHPQDNICTSNGGPGLRLGPKSEKKNFLGKWRRPK